MEKTPLHGINNAPILFYNVENLFDTANDPHNHGDDDFLPYGEMRWDEEYYNSKLTKIAEVLFMANGNAPVIAGFAEIENHRVLKDLCQHELLKKINYKTIHFDSPDSRGIDIGLLYDETKFAVLKSEKIPVLIAEEIEYKTRDILYVLGCFEGNTEVHIFVNHWSSRREGQIETEARRVTCARTLRAKIDAIQKQDQDANILVMGDFNDTPFDRSVKQILKAKSPKEKINAGELINLMYELELENEGTIKFRGDWMIFDQIIVSRPLTRGSNGLKINNKEAKIVKNEKLLFRYDDGETKPNCTFSSNTYIGGYSDHLPVYLILSRQ